jgi:hypothetical protein
VIDKSFGVLAAVLVKRGGWQKSFGLLQCSIIKIVRDISNDPGAFTVGSMQSNTRLHHSEEGSTVTVYQPTQFNLLTPEFYI